MENIDRAFTEMKAQRPDALLVLGDPFFSSSAQRNRIIALAARDQIPANFTAGVFPLNGGSRPTGRSSRTSTAAPPSTSTRS
jgi:hypothetical protein